MKTGGELGGESEKKVTLRWRWVHFTASPVFPIQVDQLARRGPFWRPAASADRRRWERREPGGAKPGEASPPYSWAAAPLPRRDSGTAATPASSQPRRHAPASPGSQRSADSAEPGGQEGHQQSNRPREPASTRESRPPPSPRAKRSAIASRAGTAPGLRRALTRGPHAPPLRLTPTSPEKQPGSRGCTRSRAAALRSVPASPALRGGSALPRRLRAPLRGTHGPPLCPGPGLSQPRSLGTRRPPSPSPPQHKPPTASRGWRLEPRWGCKRTSPPPQPSHQIPSLVRAARRKCHQRPFRSAPHFRPEPPSPHRTS